jgi:hypothetical protein
MADTARQASDQVKQAASSLASDATKQAKGFLNMQVIAGADMVDHVVDTPEQVVRFAPKAQPRAYDTPVEETGQAIIAKIQRAAELANENCDRATHKLSMELRAAEDRINELAAEAKLFRERAARAEGWLRTIHKEIEEKLIAPGSASGAEQKALP